MSPFFLFPSNPLQDSPNVLFTKRAFWNFLAGFHIEDASQAYLKDDAQARETRQVPEISTGIQCNINSYFEISVSIHARRRAYIQVIREPSNSHTHPYQNPHICSLGCHVRCMRTQKDSFKTRILDWQSDRSQSGVCPLKGAVCSLQGTNSHMGQGLAETCGHIPDAKHISNPADDGVVETE